ncbi:hypothetical protein PSECIP111951_02820 [Pseudoalteromonas holothuriae]|uniref:DUF4810 domain-containing protein n=1 Tax=Pseudoalteromonas holothuriae TaxID=2963714 RepID=A0A9W4QVT7_9GAMM|nr:MULTISPECIES: DUF4810 domain-containing protein [unclassified Pseudoalteromonas]CAH9055527.1 hypothetical protein PSECIP111854_01598 [Pseudoalteromonas sp. CIP111854]CAH9063020.1 hypothetical protein PSECIP111951_02820 [Pseudoalteromonas sp. CIP111951]
MNKILLIASVMMMFFLSGCGTTKALYYHGSYSENIYQYFKVDDTTVSEQISELEQTVQAANNHSAAIAPGILAHLGYLYLLEGNSELGFDYLQLEKQRYPESAHYIDFLIDNAKDTM